MVSIFIWKADHPLDDMKDASYLHYYHGVDWFLEEQSNTSESASYQWIHQVATPEYIYYAAKRMGTDWMGHTLLEEMEIPYKRWKEEGELCLEQLGSWNRVILPSSFSTKSRAASDILPISIAIDDVSWLRTTTLPSDLAMCP